jgi:hypothetical protein
MPLFGGAQFGATTNQKCPEVLFHTFRRKAGAEADEFTDSVAPKREVAHDRGC